jgi:hypothetical protein
VRALFARRNPASSDWVDISTRSLESAIDKYDGRAEFFAWVVVIGVIVEYVPQAAIFLRKPTWISFRDLIGGLLIALGVAGEILFGAIASRKQNQLRDLSNTIIADLDLRAETERRARVQIEQQMARRTVSRLLSGDESTKLANALQPFAGQMFQIGVYGLSEQLSEQFQFMMQLEKILFSSGWSGRILSPRCEPLSR